MEPTKVNKPVTSREYKLMLKTKPFKNREAGADAFWTEVIGPLVAAHGGEVKGKPKEKERCVWYLDTPNVRFRQTSFVLRLREEMEAARRFSLTLKYRHPDRYESASQENIIFHNNALENVDIDTKFEEDILYGFRSKFAHSTKVKFNARPSLKQMGDVLSIFPNLIIPETSSTDTISIVCDFEAFEIKRESGKIDFGEKPKIKPCLSFWYSSEEATGEPIVAEFSFDYDVSKAEKKRLIQQPNTLETFTLPIVKQTAAFFESLQIFDNAEKWFDFKGTTKTASAYSCNLLR